MAELVDWRFLYKETIALYSHTGQPSLDLVVFFKLVMVGRLENLVSDRRLVEHYALRLDILYFLGYEVDEDLPWHSTGSRTRQLYPAAVFEHLFNHVFAQCVAARLVAGDTQIVDSAPVKANASLDRLCEKPVGPLPTPTLTVAGQPPAPPNTPPTAALRSAPAHQLRYEATRQAKRRASPGGLGAHHAKARLLSNKTHYSPADPEARISVKPGKARALNYLCRMAVDEGTGVINHIQADFADQRDNVLLERTVEPLHQRLLPHHLPVQEVVADTTYSNGSNYALLEGRGITPWILVFGKYKPETAGCTYDAEADCFTCLAGKLLSFKGFNTPISSGHFTNGLRSLN